MRVDQFGLVPPKDEGSASRVHFAIKGIFTLSDRAQQNTSRLRCLDIARSQLEVDPKKSQNNILILAKEQSQCAETGISNRNTCAPTRPFSLQSQQRTSFRGKSSRTQCFLLGRLFLDIDSSFEIRAFINGDALGRDIARHNGRLL